MKVRLQAALLARSMFLMGKISAEQALDWMIIQHLSPSEKKAYAVLRHAKSPISSEEVAKIAEITPLKAAGLLASLHENGLAERSEVVQGKLQYFIYTLASPITVMGPAPVPLLEEGAL